ncbi:ribonuclease P protein component [Candidatus Peregrinibacteria bacterium]|nr:ribonuclease P protein component [Candidatus Peregrinibacteria bacterium]
MLSKKNRISNRQLLKKLFGKGKQYKNNNFIFKFLPSIEPISKFSVVVSKKVAPNAVDRNKLRRQIYDCIRNNLELLKSDIVVIIIVKSNSIESEYEDLDKGIKDFFNQNILHV